MSTLNSVCVYCGSRGGDDPAFIKAAETLGKEIGKRRLRLVYGGASIGMMGAVAKAVLASGGLVTGVIPQFLAEIELQLEEVHERITTRTMHERKQIMFDRSDAFVVLPGGVGTLEETVEMLTWRQLSRHKRPLILVNIHGYWDPFIALLRHVVDRKFSGDDLNGFYSVVPRAEDVLPEIERAIAALPGGRIEHLEQI